MPSWFSCRLEHSRDGLVRCSGCSLTFCCQNITTRSVRHEPRSTHKPDPTHVLRQWFAHCLAETFPEYTGLLSPKIDGFILLHCRIVPFSVRSWGCSSATTCILLQKQSLGGVWDSSSDHTTLIKIVCTSIVARVVGGGTPQKHHAQDGWVHGAGEKPILWCHCSNWAGF